MYDAAGRVLAARVNSDTWSCTSYDARGRVTSQTIPASTTAPARTVTNNYAVGSNPAVTSVSDNNVTGSPNSGTITTTTDWRGRTTSTNDVWNHGPMRAGRSGIVTLAAAWLSAAAACAPPRSWRPPLWWVWQPLALAGNKNRCAERSALRRPQRAQHGKAIEHTVEAVDRGLVGCAQFAVAGCATKLLEPLQHGLDLDPFVHRRRRCREVTGGLGARTRRLGMSFVPQRQVAQRSHDDPGH